ncbi:MAG: polysaccharide pyruvyl transferase family protein [Armatimonadia bacterium]
MPDSGAIKRILITDYYSPANRGDAAILEGMLHALRGVFPEASFVVHSSDPELVPLMHGQDLEAGRDLSDWLRRTGAPLREAGVRAWVRARRLGRDLRLPGEGINQTLRHYAEADLLVSKGGGFLHDYYVDVKARLLSFELAQTLGTPVCLYAQSLGPFEQPALRRLARRVLGRARLITVRDNASLEIVRGLRLNGPVIERTADAAFAMPDRRPDLPSLPRWEVPPATQASKTMLTMSIRRLSKGRHGERCAEAFVALANWAATLPGLEPTFLSTCTGLGSYTMDDRITATAVARRCEASPKVVWADYNPYELVGMLREHSALHVGMRMHSDVLALLAGVPVVAVAYEPKIHGLFEAFGLQEYVLEVADLTADNLLEKAQLAYDNREAIARQIAERLPEARAGALRNAEVLRAVMDQ